MTRRGLGAAALIVALVLGIGRAPAQEIVSLPTRPGVTQPIFVTGMLGRQPAAVALLFPGGGGYIHLRSEGGQNRFDAGNFLVRARLDFIRNQIQPVIFEAPSDQQSGDGMSDAFRASAEHMADIRAVFAELRRRFPALPVFIIGTSRGTLSAAYAARALGAEAKGVVLTASLFLRDNRSTAGSLSLYDWKAIAIPLLFVHHREDRCAFTPYAEAAKLAARFPLISVKGGKPPQSGPCDALAQHGFFGMEPRTVDAIAAWIFGRGYPREVE